MKPTNHVKLGMMLGAVAAVLILAPVAQATNGYFTHGYGTTNKGMAGAGVALPQDALTVATNPAAPRKARRVISGRIALTPLVVCGREHSC